MNTQAQIDELFCWLADRRYLCLKRELGDGGEGNTPEYWYSKAGQFQKANLAFEELMIITDQPLDALHDLLVHLSYEGPVNNLDAVLESIDAIKAIKTGLQP